MSATLVTLVPAAIGLAFSPAPLIELILVLFSRRRTVNTIAFVVSLLVFTVILLGMGAAGGKVADGNSGGTSTAWSVVLVVLGLMLTVIGVKNWRNRHDESEPAVLSTIAGMGPRAVAFLALGATFVNPKNVVLLLAAGQTLGASSSPWLSGVIFTLVATAPYTAAAGYALLGGQPAERRLDAMRVWLVRRNRLIMGVICTGLGLLLLAKGALG